MRKQTLILSLIFLTIVISGCAPSSVQELKSTTGVKQYAYEVEKNYQQIYVDYKRNLNNCIGWENPGVSQTAKGELYSELGYSEIKFGLTGQVQIYIKMTKIDTNMTAVKAYNNYENVNLKKILSGICE